MPTCHPAGRLEWIGIRPARREPLVAVPSATLQPGRGIAGDHFRPRSGSIREVTLIRHEHLAEIGAPLGEPPIDPARLRRNLAVSGIDLASLIGAQFSVGPVVLQATGPCSPCARMDEALGPGGRKAISGKGGITAIVLQGGTIQVGDRVESRRPTNETTVKRSG